MGFVYALSPPQPELRFLLAAAVVVYAGSKLSKYGSVFSEKLRLGGALVGMIFMAFATALPELVTSLGSVAVEKQPNLALGNNLGSIFFNIAIFAALDFFSREGPVYAKARSGLLVPAASSVLVLAVFAGGMALEAALPGTVPELPLVGLDSFLALAAYVLCAWLIRRGEAREEPREAAEGARGSLGWAAAKYVLTALAILWAGLNLARAGRELAANYGLSHSFVGALFLAVSTSLPEVAATIPMVRRGMHEMAFGNLFGSNAFNVMILVVSDAVYSAPETSEYRNLTANAMDAGPEGAAHLVTVLCAVAMTTVVILGMCTRLRKKVLRLSWPSYLLVLFYLAGAFALYALKG